MSSPTFRSIHCHEDQCRRVSQARNETQGSELLAYSLILKRLWVSSETPMNLPTRCGARRYELLSVQSISFLTSGKSVFLKTPKSALDCFTFSFLSFCLYVRITESGFFNFDWCNLFFSLPFSASPFIGHKQTTMDVFCRRECLPILLPRKRNFSRFCI